MACFEMRVSSRWDGMDAMVHLRDLAHEGFVCSRNHVTIGLNQIETIYYSYY